MSAEVKVKTDGDNFASIEHERVLVEFSKDGDSPNCPNSWTWGLWFDGCEIDSTCDEASLAKTVRDTVSSINGIVKELEAVADYLTAYGAFGEVPL